jgi:hypothetical protein
MTGEYKDISVVIGVVSLLIAVFGVFVGWLTYTSHKYGRDDMDACHALCGTRPVLECAPPKLRCAP